MTATMKAGSSENNLAEIGRIFRREPGMPGSFLISGNRIKTVPDNFIPDFVANL